MAELGFLLVGLAGFGFMALAVVREHTMPRHTIWEHGAATAEWDPTRPSEGGL